MFENPTKSLIECHKIEMRLFSCLWYRVFAAVDLLENPPSTPFTFSPKVENQNDETDKERLSQGNFLFNFK